MAKDDVKIIFEAEKDEYLAGLKEMQNAMKRTWQVAEEGEKKQQQEADKTKKKLDEKTGAVGKLRLAYIALVAIGYQVVGFFGDMVREATEFIRVEGQLRQGAYRTGDALRSLKRIISQNEGGMFSQKDISQAVAYASVQGMTAEQIEKLLPLLRDASALFGEDLTLGITAVTRAMKFGEAELAERIGLQLRENGVVETSTKMYGKKLSQLTASQKEEVVYAAAIEQLNNFLGAENNLLDMNIGKLGKQEAAMQDIRKEVGERLIPVKTLWYNLFNYFLQGINKVIEGWEYLIGLVFDYDATVKKIMEKGESPEEQLKASAKIIDRKEAELAKRTPEQRKTYIEYATGMALGYGGSGMSATELQDYYEKQYDENTQRLQMEIDAEKNKMKRLQDHLDVLEEQEKKRFALELDTTTTTIPGGGKTTGKQPLTLAEFAEMFDKQGKDLLIMGQLAQDVGEEWNMSLEAAKLYRKQLEELALAGYQGTELYKDILEQLEVTTYNLDLAEKMQIAQELADSIVAWMKNFYDSLFMSPQERYEKEQEWAKRKTSDKPGLFERIGIAFKQAWNKSWEAVAKKQQEVKDEKDWMKDMRNSLAETIPNILTKGFADLKEGLRMLMQNLGPVFGKYVAGPKPSFGEEILGGFVGAIFGLFGAMIGGGGRDPWGQAGAVPVNVVEFLGQREPFPLPSSAYFAGDRGGNIDITINGNFPDGLASAIDRTVQSYFDDQRRGNIF